MLLFWPKLNTFWRPLVGAGGGRWKVESMIVGGGGAGSTGIGIRISAPVTVAQIHPRNQSATSCKKEWLEYWDNSAINY